MGGEPCLYAVRRLRSSRGSSALITRSSSGANKWVASNVAIRWRRAGILFRQLMFQVLCACRLLLVLVQFPSLGS